MVEQGQKLHIVAVPLHFIFRKMQEVEFRNIERIYLVSAHVEPSESSGLSGFLGHISGHFSNVANYHKGKRIGKKLLEGRRCDLSPVEKLRSVDTRTVKTTESVMSRSIRDVADEPLVAVIPSLFLLGTIIGELLGYVDLQAGLAESFSTLPYPYDRIMRGCVGIAFILTSLYWVYSSFRILSDTEKWGLYGVYWGSGFGIVGILLLHVSIFNPSPQTGFVFSFVFHAWILSYLYLLGVFIPRLRFITVASFTFALEVVFLQWFPDFLIYMGIPNSVELQMFLALGFALLISFFVGLFHNFMKSVELILEIEHSFAIFVGRMGVSRAALKQDLGEIVGIDEKQGLFERITGKIRVYLGFRPQGTLEFHLDLPLESNNAIETDDVQVVDDSIIYPVKDVIFDGASLRLTIKTSSGYSVLRFAEFRPQ